MSARSNAFGEVRAEQDHGALDVAFFEWRDYKTLFESTDRFIVVGRRGTGKSALTYKLKKVWSGRKFPLILVAPNEDEVIGLRPVARYFGSSVMRIRAGIRLAWRYALLMEIVLQLSHDYKSKARVEAHSLVREHLARWKRAGDSIIPRLRCLLKEFSSASVPEEERIADLAGYLSLNQVTEAVSGLVSASGQTFVVLTDRLDEGYEPDSVGTGLIDGILYGTDEVRTSLGSSVRAIVFIRDNIFRAIESEDNDFSRNLESQVLRLHWDPQELFYMVCARIRALFNISRESDVKVWNSITVNELHGREGFKECLKHTLYRPRDVIALLNSAFYQAQRQSRDTLIVKDFEEAAKQISKTRFMDLGKEYESVIPGTKALTSAFSGTSPKMRAQQAMDIVSRVLASTDHAPSVMQEFKIFSTPDEALKALYGVGFFGVYDSSIGAFVYSHDGRSAALSVGSDDVMMIHPCYWGALNFDDRNLSQADAEAIHDEYEISIRSESSDQRKQVLGQLMSQYNSIPEGPSGASDFELWCKRAIEICFAGHLDNVELKANGAAAQRRDIVATNQSQGGVWQRVLSDYGSRQIVFEVKNYDSIGIEEFRQVHSYLEREYGKFGIILCRDTEFGLRKGGELDAFREFYSKGFLIIKFPASQLVTVISKLRSPEKIDAGSKALNKILDHYIRMHASGQGAIEPKKRRGRGRKH